MKKSLIFAALALVAFVGCNKMETATVAQKQAEMNFTPLNGAVPSRGYSLDKTFDACSFSSLHSDATGYWRNMQISAYLYPQNGEQGNYFVDKTYARNTDLEDGTWVNWEGGKHTPIYWPVGGTMDFLAYSLSEDVNVDVVWNEENAASQVVLDVPAENSQNDILFASAYGIKAPSSAKAVSMVFNHAQAWLEFQLTGTMVDGKGVVTLKRIELENIYNAGVLTINNNKGNATATWDFSDETKKNIEVDSNYDAGVLTSDISYLDMLIPQQKKTAFVIYYTLGTDTQELSYRFTTDQKTWLMGEKYIYKINITTSEVTVAPSVTKWVDGDVADVDAQTSTVEGVGEHVIY